MKKFDLNTPTPVLSPLGFQENGLISPVISPNLMKTPNILGENKERTNFDDYFGAVLEDDENKKYMKQRNTPVKGEVKPLVFDSPDMFSPMNFDSHDKIEFPSLDDDTFDISSPKYNAFDSPLDGMSNTVINSPTYINQSTTNIIQNFNQHHSNLNVSGNITHNPRKRKRSPGDHDGTEIIRKKLKMSKLKIPHRANGSSDDISISPHTHNDSSSKVNIISKKVQREFRIMPNINHNARQPLHFVQMREETIRRGYGYTPHIKQPIKRSEVIQTNESVKNLIEPRSVWVTKYIDERFKNKLSVNITTRTRCDDYGGTLPNTMYSSLKYVIHEKFITTLSLQNIPFILSKVTIVDALDDHEILKNKKVILKGTIQSAMALNKNEATLKDGITKVNVFEGKLNVQFTDVSYHHKKHDFAFKISYYTPGDLNNPILIKKSAAYKVLARKPNQGKKKKRKKKKSGIDNFTEKLEELIRSSKGLGKRDKKNAFKMVSEKLKALDPQFFGSISNDEDEE